MRSLLIASAMVWAVSGSSASFARSYESAYPYEIQTVAAAAQLRCGPGNSFYVTERLARGQTLTVFRQAPGGWLAVRPTKNSFSLMAARHGRATGQTDVVEVIDQHAVSWIGTRDREPPEFKWQVRLQPGERVVVLGQETRRAFPGGPRETHLRIEPPAGEFRWIHEKDVRHVSQLEEDEPAPPRNVKLTDFRVVVEDEVEDEEADEEAVEEADEEARRDGFVARPRRAVTAATAVAAALVDPPGDATPDRPEDKRADSPRQARRPTRASQTPKSDLPPLSAKAFERLYRDLDVQLSLMVAKPVQHWKLDELRDDTDHLLARGGTTVDRGRAQLLAEKVEEFEQLQSRFRTSGISASSIGDAETSGQAAPVLPPVATQLDPRFDGTGWLYPVHSRNHASPPYALLNAKGAILQFVSPAPGLNIHRYLEQEIGVFGQQATSSKLDKPHVTVERVVSLKRHRR